LARTLYEILGLTPGASLAVVKQAFEEVSAKLEPRTSVSTEDRNELTAAKEAYRTLSSPERRAAYDASLIAASGSAYQRAPYPTYVDRNSWFDSLLPG
jgi:curved DNA-binding protein CbpA